MTQNITLDDFYALFRESERQRQETERLIRESLEASRQQFERALAESSDKFDRELTQSLEASRQQFERELAESRAEYDREMAESRAEYDRRIAKTEAIAAKTNKAVNGLTSRWGRFVESLVAPAALRLFQERGILVDRTLQRLKAPRGKNNLEIDIFAVNGTIGVVIEVKSRLTQKHVRKFLKKLEVFKSVFTEYSQHQLYGAMAAIDIDGDVDTYAENQGLFIIEQSGNTVYISTDSTFTPRTW